MTRILLVGEAWGQKEAMFEHAFVGSSGAELARMLAQADLAPEPIKYPSELDMLKHWKLLRESHGIDTANVFPFQPLDGDILNCFTTAAEGDTSLPPLLRGKYVKPELVHHLYSLWEKVQTLKPTLIIALGNPACWALLGETKISTLRGTVKISPMLNMKVLPTYNPAAVLRQWNLRTVVMTDLDKAKRECEFPELRRIQRFVTVEPTLEEIAEWVTRPAEYYSVDIETVRGKLDTMITMVGFARTPADAIVIPFFDATKPESNYWPDTASEMQAWRYTGQLLESPVPKIFQNGVFDLTHLYRAGLRPKACLHDTMLFHHSLYPEMLKGLGFLGSIYSNEISWKKMAKAGNNLKRDE